ncbi:MAG: hypothetical protein ACU0C9_04200 [Paracoccaceae bacterium]
MAQRSEMSIFRVISGKRYRNSGGQALKQPWAKITGMLHRYFWPHFMPMRISTDKNGHAADQAASHIPVDRALTLIDAHIGGRDWRLGDSKSVADAFLYPMASRAYGFEKSTTEYKNIDRLIRAFRLCMYHKAHWPKSIVLPDTCRLSTTDASRCNAGRVALSHPSDVAGRDAARLAFASTLCR